MNTDFVRDKSPFFAAVAVNSIFWLLCIGAAALFGGFCGAGVSATVDAWMFPDSSERVSYTILPSLFALDAIAQYAYASVAHFPGVLLATLMVGQLQADPRIWLASKGWLFAMGVSAGALLIAGTQIWDALAFYVLGSEIPGGYGLGWLIVALNVVVSASLTWFGVKWSQCRGAPRG
jgi:hypothetical protein